MWEVKVASNVQFKRYLVAFQLSLSRLKCRIDRTRLSSSVYTMVNVTEAFCVLTRLKSPDPVTTAHDCDCAPAASAIAASFAFAKLLFSPCLPFYAGVSD